MAVSPRITQVGLGIDEGDEAAAVDAWWNPPPSPPVTCPSSIPPAELAGDQVTLPLHLGPTSANMRQTISLEVDE
jgi:hypothetical protein